MNSNVIKPLAAYLALTLLAGGCSTVKSVWPFRGDVEERPHTPSDAVAYQCDGGKTLYLRNLEGGAAVWVILPERQFRLPRDGESGGRYTNGSATLELKDGAAGLSEGPGVAYANCKVQAGK